MTLPTQVNVGSLRYRVLTDVKAIRKASDDAAVDGEWAAFSDHDRLVIGINPANPLDVQRRDLFHELLHCCLRFSGVWPDAYAHVVERAKGKHGGYTVEEAVVAGLTGALLDTLRRSSGLAEFLLGVE